MTKPCREYDGRLDRYGYGCASFGGKKWLVHRLAWHLGRGPIPKGMAVCHHCDNRRCFELEHLFLGSVQDNRADCVAKSRHARGEEHGLAKLDSSRVRAIRSLRDAGWTTLALAERFGVSSASISNIVNGHTWRHVR
jgi:hypothetical protein